jgi:hypothetical protein
VIRFLLKTLFFAAVAAALGVATWWLARRYTKPT